MRPHTGPPAQPPGTPAAASTLASNHRVREQDAERAAMSCWRAAARWQRSTWDSVTALPSQAPGLCPASATRASGQAVAVAHGKPWRHGTGGLAPALTKASMGVRPDPTPTLGTGRSPGDMHTTAASKLTRRNVADPTGQEERPPLPRMMVRCPLRLATPDWTHFPGGCGPNSFEKRRIQILHPLQEEGIGGRYLAV
jgi:hypothetical protein